MSTRRAQQKQENRAKLMAAARKVFAEKGLGAATARDIVRETDLATGTFYNYFDDKEDCFRTLLSEFTAEARAAAREKRLQPGISLEDRIRDAYRAYFELVVADPEMFEVLRRNADAIAMLGGEHLFDEAAAEFAEDMAAWVAEGQLPAAIGPWLPYVARSVAGAAFQVAAQMADQGDSDVDAAADFCARVLLDGLRGFG